MDDDECPAPWEMDRIQPSRPEDGHLPADAPAPMNGLDWETLRDVLASPFRMQSTILKLACLLAQERTRSTTVQAAAAQLKASEVALLEAVSAMPTLFKLRAGGHRVELTRPGDDPSVESPRQRKERERREREQSTKAARAERREEEDGRDTLFNALRRKVEDLGIDRDRARDFAGHLCRTYGTIPSTEAVEEAARQRPADPKPYVIGILKRRVGGGAPAGFPTRVPATAKPSAARETTLIGWSHAIPRVRFYRKPDGTIKRVAPRIGESVPSVAEDPGFVVAA